MRPSSCPDSGSPGSASRGQSPVFTQPHLKRLPSAMYSPGGQRATHKGSRASKSPCRQDRQQTPAVATVGATMGQISRVALALALSIGLLPFFGQSIWAKIGWGACACVVPLLGICKWGKLDFEGCFWSCMPVSFANFVRDSVFCHFLANLCMTVGGAVGILLKRPSALAILIRYAMLGQPTILACHHRPSSRKHCSGAGGVMCT